MEIEPRLRLLVAVASRLLQLLDVGFDIADVIDHHAADNGRCQRIDGRPYSNRESWYELKKNGLCHGNQSRPEFGGLQNSIESIHIFP
jgi:hypothetical protein